MRNEDGRWVGYRVGRCLALTASTLPQAPFLYRTEPRGHKGNHVAVNLHDGTVEKTWPQAPWDSGATG